MESGKKLVTKPISQYPDRFAELKQRKRSLFGTLVKAMSKRELVSMDFFRGVAEMAEAIESKRRCHIPADFVLHVNELTLAMQNAGEQGKPYELTTNFEPLQLRQASLLSGHHYGEDSRNFLTATIEKVIQRLHRH